MEPIKNSVIKESFRQKNMESALREITLLEDKHCSDTPRKQSSGNVIIFMIIGGVCGGPFGGAAGFGVGLFFGFVAWVIYAALCEHGNDSNQKNYENKQIDLAQKKDQILMRADQRTMQQIKNYDEAVSLKCQSMLKNPGSLQPMVQCIVNMMKRMVSHCENGPHVKFLEAVLTYTVYSDRIVFFYQSGYSNPQDDFVFAYVRLRDLTTPEECEGLAQALTRLAMPEIKASFPPNSLNISMDHIDAQVTLYLKEANPNFVPAKNIY